MTMPGEVKANCRTEIANKSSDSNDFECQVDMVAAPLVSPTTLTSSSSTKAQPPGDLSPDKSQTTANSSTTSLALKTAASRKAPTYIHAATNPHSPNGLYIVHQKDCGNSMEFTNPTPSSSSASTASSALLTHAKRTSDCESIKKLFLTTSMMSSSRSPLFPSEAVTATESGNQVKFGGNENSVNFDRGKELMLEEVAEIADEVCGEKREVAKDVCNANSKSCDEIANIDVVSDDSRISGNEQQIVLGCVHYKRRAMFVTPCCNKFYKCRYCHDENEDHHFDRKTLTELICSECDTRQRVQETCENCGVRFGKYTCLICNLFDDEDKSQYHCYGCGICRIGGRKNFFHCEVCNMCLPIQLKIEGHRCVENISRSNCPVCLGDIHTSRIPCHIPDCGHLLHKMCFDQLLASGHYVCPTCQTSIIDMTQMWEYLDAQALIMPVPKAYEDRYLNIFCNDCHKTSTVKFHFIGLKCFYCGGYNTTQDMKRRRSWVTVNDNASSA